MTLVLQIHFPQIWSPHTIFYSFSRSTIGLWFLIFEDSYTFGPPFDQKFQKYRNTKKPKVKYNYRNQKHN
jgi:hypothetical protein